MSLNLCADQLVLEVDRVREGPELVGRFAGLPRIEGGGQGGLAALDVGLRVRLAAAGRQGDQGEG